MPALPDTLYPDELQTETATGRLYPDRFLTIGQLRNLPPLEPLIAGPILDLNTCAILFGSRGSYKSFVALDWALSVATGTRWHGRPVSYGNVVYVTAEGVHGITKRVDAWQAAHPLDNVSALDDRLVFLPEPVNLLNAATMGQFRDAITAARPQLVVLDTLSRCFTGGDENSGKDGTIAVEQWDFIRRDTGACVLLVHHAGKNTAAGSRGWSGWEAAADHVYYAERAGTRGLTLKCTKAKNHAEPADQRFTMKAAGPSLVLDALDADSDTVSDGALDALRVLRDLDDGTGVPATVWREATGQANGTFYRSRSELVGRGAVENVGTETRTRYRITASSTPNGAWE